MKFIKQFWFIFLEKCLLFIVAVYAIGCCIIVYSSYQNMKMFESGDLYIYHGNIKENVSEDVTDHPEKYLKSFQGLYDYLTDNYKVDMMFENTINNNDIYAENALVTTNAYFFKLYNITPVAGTIFSDADKNDVIIPVVIGSDYSKEYKLNSVFTLEDPNDGIVKKFKVIGILGPETTYLQFDQINWPISLNDKIIKPFTKADYNNTDSLNSGISGMVILIDNDKDLKAINAYFDKMGIFDKTLDNVKNWTNFLHSTDEQWLMIMGGVVTLLLACSVSVCILKVKNIVKKNIRNYIIEYFCGSSMAKIRRDLVGKLCLIDTFIFIVTLLLVSFNRNNFYVVALHINYLALSIAYVLCLLVNFLAIVFIKRWFNKKSLFMIEREAK